MAPALRKRVPPNRKEEEKKEEERRKEEEKKKKKTGKKLEKAGNAVVNAVKEASKRAGKKIKTIVQNKPKGLKPKKRGAKKVVKKRRNERLPENVDENPAENVDENPAENAPREEQERAFNGEAEFARAERRRRRSRTKTQNNIRAQNLLARNSPRIPFMLNITQSGSENEDEIDDINEDLGNLNIGGDNAPNGAAIVGNQEEENERVGNRGENDGNGVDQGVERGLDVGDNNVGNADIGQRDEDRNVGVGIAENAENNAGENADNIVNVGEPMGNAEEIPIEVEPVEVENSGVNGTKKKKAVKNYGLIRTRSGNDLNHTKNYIWQKRTPKKEEKNLEWLSLESRKLHKQYEPWRPRGGFGKKYDSSQFPKPGQIDYEAPEEDDDPNNGQGGQGGNGGNGGGNVGGGNGGGNENGQAN
ncbi:unnamed protein product [Caenorhabditis angaria]|uniref:Uncharacterized protein n=1 Tax=Caenorhabditis angaria TaxID=860376 RepID=A0A9P1J525_9PELO|nr:unnamed protein product [Caenorhabditis angaria]